MLDRNFDPSFSSSQSTTPGASEVQQPVFLDGTENPFHKFALQAKSHLEGLNLDGEAQIPKSKGQFDYVQVGETRTMTYAEIAGQSRGWKFHLNFDPDDATEVQTVDDFLTALKDEDIIRSFKIGNGGGKYGDQPGKEATVYVGHRDKANVVAGIIEEGLGGSLDGPEGAALTDDMAFTPHVMGRFDTAASDWEFHQYGVPGHPILNDDMASLLVVKLDPDARKQRFVEFGEHAEQILRNRYGVFYTGTSGQ